MKTIRKHHHSFYVEVIILAWLPSAGIAELYTAHKRQGGSPQASLIVNVDELITGYEYTRDQV